LALLTDDVIQELAIDFTDGASLCYQNHTMRAKQADHSQKDEYLARVHL
jgi:hypothetical protein